MPVCCPLRLPLQPEIVDIEVNLRICIAIACIQAAYNNSSEVEVNDSIDGELSDQINQLGEYISGTKIAKQFDAEWWEGAIRRYDAEEDLYWVLYTDGDSEELDANEARQGVQDHKDHMQPAVVAAVKMVDAADEADSTVAAVTQGERMVIGAAQACCSAATSYTLPAEMATAIAALATAAERLAAAADHIITQSSDFQQQQQLMFLQQQQSRLQQQHMHMVQQQEVFVRQQQQQRFWLQQPQRWYLQWR